MNKYETKGLCRESLLVQSSVYFNSISRLY